MRRLLFLCLLAAMTFLLAACSMQPPNADLSAVDANTEDASNNATQSGVSGEPDELPAKEEENTCIRFTLTQRGQIWIKRKTSLRRSAPAKMPFLVMRFALVVTRQRDKHRAIRPAILS